MRVRPLALALLLVTLAACNGAAGPTDAPDASANPTGSASQPADSAEPATPEPTLEPVASPTPEPATSDEPGESPSPSGSDGPGAADACSGTDQNREFFETASAVLDWTVYCARLPSGWFVDAGEYRQAGGGRLEISYRGPGGARFELHEGAYCADGGDCVPAGSDVGDAPLGELGGTLIATDDGGWAIVVDRGAPISWLAVGTGMDDATFLGFAADVAAVDG